jgi:hypothetical protein
MFFLTPPLFNEVLQEISGWFMVFYTTLKNISAISWRSAVLMEETGVPG